MVLNVGMSAASLALRRVISESYAQQVWLSHTQICPTGRIISHLCVTDRVISVTGVCNRQDYLTVMCNR